MDNTVKIWSIVQNKCLGTIRIPDTVVSAHWDSEDDNVIYTLCVTKIFK